MAIPNKKMRVTFLWADESALMEDFRKKSSKRMVTWANAFFGKYGFELDVTPDLNTSMANAKKFCLSKMNGYEPDRISQEELQNMIFKESYPALKKWLDLLKEIDALEIQKKEKSDQIDIIRTQLANLPSTDTDGQTNLREKLVNLYDEQRQLLDNFNTKELAKKDLEKILDAVDSKYKKRKEELDLDIQARLQISKKVVESFPLSVITGIKSKDENPAIVDNSRLKIIFCRFKLSPAVLTLTRASQPFGMALQSIDFNTYNGQYLWDGPFILINVSRYEDITIAHEIVHTTGRPDIPDVRVVKNIFQWMKSGTMDPLTQKVKFDSIYEYVYGGNFESPNDIINYNSKGKKPSEVILAEEDQKNLKKAFFVVDP